MIGLIIVSHGREADNILLSMEEVVGKQEQIIAVCIGPNDDMEQRRRDIADAIAYVDTGDGVIILVDLFGGTPSNLAISLLESNKVEVITGYNLPMLIRAAGARKQGLSPFAAAQALKSAGQNYITIASELLSPPEHGDERDLNRQDLSKLKENLVRVRKSLDDIESSLDSYRIFYSKNPGIGHNNPP